MANIILSAFADEYADSFEEQLFGLCKLGISHIEIRHVNKKNISVLTKTEVLEAKKLLDKYGIKVSAIGSPLGKIKLDGDIDGHIETAKKVFEYASILGAKFIRVFSFYAPEGKNIIDMRDEVFSALGRLLEAAKEYGVVLCHENEAMIYGDIPARCRELLDAFPDLACVYDMGNYVLEGVESNILESLWKCDKLELSAGVKRGYSESFYILTELYRAERDTTVEGKMRNALYAVGNIDR